MVSGYMWNQIRTPPYVMPGPKGQLNYFAAGYQQQYGVETQIIFSICASFHYILGTETEVDLVHRRRPRLLGLHAGRHDPLDARPATTADSDVHLVWRLAVHVQLAPRRLPNEKRWLSLPSHVLARSVVRRTCKGILYNMRERQRFQSSSSSRSSRSRRKREFCARTLDHDSANGERETHLLVVWTCGHVSLTSSIVIASIKLILLPLPRLILVDLLLPSDHVAPSTSLCVVHQAARTE